MSLPAAWSGLATQRIDVCYGHVVELFTWDQAGVPVHAESQSRSPPSDCTGNVERGRWSRITRVGCHAQGPRWNKLGSELTLDLRGPTVALIGLNKRDEEAKEKKVTAFEAGPRPSGGDGCWWQGWESWDSRVGLVLASPQRVPLAFTIIKVVDQGEIMCRYC